jgi:hypothetical protein
MFGYHVRAGRWYLEYKCISTVFSHVMKMTTWIYILVTEAYSSFSTWVTYARAHLDA